MKIELFFGGLAPTLKDQLCRQGVKVPLARLVRLQGAIDTTTTLAVQAFITDAERLRIHRRLIKAVLHECQRTLEPKGKRKP